MASIVPVTSFRSALQERLSLRIFKRWKVKLSAVDGLEDVADEVQHARAEHAVERYWTRWRQMTHLRAAGKCDCATSRTKSQKTSHENLAETDVSL